MGSDANISDPQKEPIGPPTEPRGPIGAGYLDRHLAAVLAVMIMAIGALDCISTELALGTGMAMEANPIVRALQSAFGDFWIWPKMTLHGLLAISVIVAPTRAALVAMAAVSMLTLAAALNNLAIFFEMTARLS